MVAHNRISVEEFVEMVNGEGNWRIIRTKGSPTKISLRRAVVERENNDLILTIEGWNGNPPWITFDSKKHIVKWRLDGSIVEIYRSRKDPSIMRILIPMPGKTNLLQRSKSEGGGSYEVPAFKERLAIKEISEDLAREKEEEELKKKEKFERELLPLAASLKSSIGKNLVELSWGVGFSEWGVTKCDFLKLIFSDGTVLRISPEGGCSCCDNKSWLDVEVSSTSSPES